MNFIPTARMRDPVLAAWTILRFAQKPVPLIDIVMAEDGTGPRAAVTQIIDLLKSWCEANLIERTGKPESYIMKAEARAFRDPPAVGQTALAPKLRSTRQRIWSAVRVMKNFDLVEICFAASVDKITARGVLNQLTRAGYLIRMDRDGDDHPRWRLGRSTGPRHPSVEYAPRSRTVVALVDRNSGQRFPLAPAQKILPAVIHHVS